MSLYAATTPEAAERAALALGDGWLAAMRADAEAARLAQLDAWIANPRSPAEVARWTATEGLDARLAIVERLRRWLAEAGRYGRYSFLGTYLRSLYRGPHVELPWLWVELFAAVPGHKRLVAVELLPDAASPVGAASWPAIEHAIRRWPPFPHRGMLARRLEAAGRVTAELARAWLADPALRPIGEAYLRPRAAEHEKALRERLAGAAEGERDAVIRLLRTVDARIALDGTVATDDDAELQARQRVDPADATTSMVWADLLASAGDPRGEHLALEHAIGSAEPARALELSRAQAVVCGQYRKAIWNRPGGFPYREKYRGRELLGFASDWNHRIRGKPHSVFDRVQEFVNHVTTAAGPVDVYLGHARRPGDSGRSLAPASPVEVELVRVLGNALVYDDTPRFVRRADPSEPLADVDGLRALCLAHPEVTLRYEFQLCWPGTRIPLPHQEGEHYSGGEPLIGRLSIQLAKLDLDLVLRFPYESFDDPQFCELYDTISATLGRVLTASRFLKLTSSADTKRMIARLARFSRPAA